jgi:hypothetical protein
LRGEPLIGEFAEMPPAADLEFSVQTRIAFFSFQMYWTLPITSGGSLMRKLTP